MRDQILEVLWCDCLPACERATILLGAAYDAFFAMYRVVESEMSTMVWQWVVLLKERK